MRIFRSAYGGELGNAARKETLKLLVGARRRVIGNCCRLMRRRMRERTAIRIVLITLRREAGVLS
jgi:hypothetical protein